MSLSGFFYDKESADKPGRPGRPAAVLPPSGPSNCCCPAFLAPRYL